METMMIISDTSSAQSTLGIKSKKISGRGSYDGTLSCTKESDAVDIIKLNTRQRNAEEKKRKGESLLKTCKTL